MTHRYIGVKVEEDEQDDSKWKRDADILGIECPESN